MDVAVLALAGYEEVDSGALAVTFDLGDNDGGCKKDDDGSADEKGAGRRAEIATRQVTDAQYKRDDHQQTDRPFEARPMNIGFHITAGKAILHIGRQPVDIQTNDRHAEDQQRDDTTEDAEPDAHIFPIVQLLAFPFINGISAQKGHGEPGHGGIVYDPRLNDREQHRHHPEKQHHPLLEIAVEPAVVFGAKEGGDHEDRGREASHQQDDVMISEKAFLVGVVRAEQAPLIFQELVDEPGTPFDRLVSIPGERHDEGSDHEKQGMPPAEIDFEAVIEEVYSQRQQEHHKRYLALGQHGKTHEDARPGDVIQLGFVDTGFVELVPFPMIEDEIIQRKKGEQVEPGSMIPDLKYMLGKSEPPYASAQRMPNFLS